MSYKNKKIDVKLSVPGVGGITGTWEPDESQIKASWELYIELSTRASIIPLKEEEGILREALSSLYSLFAVSREILKKYGPSIAIAKEGTLSFGYLTVRILNNVIRPFLSKWHPALQDYEETRNSLISQSEHEKKWDKNKELRADLEYISLVLYEYSLILGEVAGVPPLVQRDS